MSHSTRGSRTALDAIIAARDVIHKNPGAGVLVLIETDYGLHMIGAAMSDNLNVIAHDITSHPLLAGPGDEPDWAETTAGSA